MKQRVFVANRGEIAVRIARACQSLGFETVLGVSAADRETLGAKLVDQVVVLGPERSTGSYLNLNAVVHAAQATNCTMIHPGYGFLAENPELADNCGAAGIRFVGPSATALRELGDKTRARELATELGLPIAPGGRTQNEDEAAELADSIGYPVLIKAAHGGGGKGMKRVDAPNDLRAAWRNASLEAEAAFGDGTVFIEQFITRARHIELQILGDEHGNYRAFGLRDCSIQHRHQKVIEEAGANLIPPHHEAALIEGGLALAARLNYVGLGTIEFLYDEERDSLSFLEVNPRLQVEHPITEAITGYDLVREQLLACSGEEIDFAQQDISTDGHAIECRITAQDPERNLFPSPGRVAAWRFPSFGYTRLDSHIYEGYVFPPFYDALMGKLIIWGETREQAISRLQGTLAAAQVSGTPTNIPLLKKIIGTPEFVHNQVTTTWLTDRLEEGKL